MSTVIFWILFIIIIVGLIFIKQYERKYRAIKKGDDGEEIVAKILGENIPDQQYIINNYLFIDKSGKSRQIDHIFINQYGIWVIETKNYSGTIYGNEKQREWTQVYNFGNEKYKFYNPIKQNITHIYCLAEILNVKNIFNNVVVFIGEADISNLSINNIFSKYNIEDIKTQQTSIHLTKEQMKTFYNKLIEIESQCELSEYQHIKNIEKMQNDIREGICPRCGGKLVLRNGKNGEFYGCSNYPKCKFTKNIDEV